GTKRYKFRYNVKGVKNENPTNDTPSNQNRRNSQRGGVGGGRGSRMRPPSRASSISNLSASSFSVSVDTPTKLAERELDARPYSGQNEAPSTAGPPPPRPQAGRLANNAGQITSYPMRGSPKGICLIINNVKFSSPDWGERYGSDNDATRLKKIFSGK